MALLRDLIADHGRVKAAEVLRVSYRTLARAADTGRLTGRMSDALERYLLLGGGSHAVEIQNRLEEVEVRIGGLEADAERSSEVVRNEWGELREYTEQALVALEVRLSALESERVRAEREETAHSAADQHGDAYIPELVVPDQVSGDGETHEPWASSVAAWRLARVEFEEAEDGAARLKAEQRLLEIEIELVGKYGLTLPPANYPWDRFELAAEVRRRKRRLAKVRSERAWAELRRSLRRMFTLGIAKG